MGQGIQVQAQTHQTVQNVDNNDTNVKEVFDSESTLTTPQTNTEGKYKHNEDSLCSQVHFVDFSLPVG
jgi:hypothetical protein